MGLYSSESSPAGAACAQLCWFTCSHVLVAGCVMGLVGGYLMCSLLASKRCNLISNVFIQGPRVYVIISRRVA